MRIAIIEDMPEDSEHLLRVLDTYMKTIDFAPVIDCFSSGEDFLAALEPEIYDLCFMDIYMDGMNGMDTAVRLRDIDPVCRVIFLTSSTDYMADGYRIRAWRYLLKPVSAEQLAEALEESVEEARQAARTLTVSSNRRVLHIPFSKIWYVTTADRTIEVHNENTFFTVGKQKSFDALTRPLQSDYRFLLIGRGLIVNLAYAQSIKDGCLLMQNGDLLPISRSRTSEVSDAFVRFRFEHR